MKTFTEARRVALRRPTLLAAAALAALSTQGAHAFQVATDMEDLKLRFDNTVKYSVGMRLKDPSTKLTSDVNMDDGNRNFDKGALISNRLDLLSEFDATYGNVGFRISGAAWYDDVYNRSNDNNSPLTNNSTSVAHDQFTHETRDLHGRKVELLDALVSGRVQLGDTQLAGRLGKHTLLYGESLFFGGNGIAAAQAPLDIVKLLSVPNTPFKELMMPVPQVSGQLQISPQLSAGAYYQTRWEKDRLPGAGSYFSGVDILDDGGESFILGPGFALKRTADQKAKNSGQGGAQLRYLPEGVDAEFGFYAVRWNAKSPVVYLNIPGGVYNMVYPENIRAFGASMSTTVEEVNVGAEVSVRSNMPLVSQAGGVTSLNAIPVGKTFHAQASWIALLHASPLWQGGTFMGEVAYHRITSVTANEASLDPNGTRSASALRFIFKPEYYQVMDGVDIGIPIGLGWGLQGRSLLTNPGFSVEHGGDLSIGVSGDYQKIWKFGVSYTTFLGKSDNALTPANSAAAAYSYKQNMKDRDYISLTFQHTF